MHYNGRVHRGGLIHVAVLIDESDLTVGLQVWYIRLSSQRDAI